MAISETKLPAYGLLGGSFDPIHQGHVTLAEEVRRALALEQMALLPAHRQPLKNGAGASSIERAEMARLAIQDYPELTIDTRELEREGPSYTVDTLRDWRRSYGHHCCLCFCMGLDSLLQLHRWKAWPELFELANLVVFARPGWAWGNALAQDATKETKDALPEVLKTQLLQRRCENKEELLQHSNGRWFELEAPLMDISSTHIRQQLSDGAPPLEVAHLPEAVAKYIDTHGLYCAP
ncbi:nicotinate-nucleotide adenylyltransferase [Pseudoteredinibacter isoporae]|uniref:Probable nicotinate-nucleotide adenylyltransferase n=1 Tax=Pseudoteredinibacter isoporae TaxID=570281 RepID=A0A7X0JWD2_9GAMM|nr:nicotinate-nucleotide adenylyltransferase [Pseudoteredinibacter isoporae]MBB6522953.1 nicotinate-nucleotide adenylyltransferase [Pseudoteredinibacter isoporae]NHO88477.1 nicotinate-nucleotide adenylyltransferase [Pseudoteredinibacter isoporae]NIB22124.1 nicotinate-nucleotide adenylyltransferase [Pseudoteredinibacter isoporae]